MNKKGIIILVVIFLFMLSIFIGNKIRNRRIDRYIHAINVDSYSKDLSVSDDSLTIDWEKSKVYINGYVAYYDKELELKVKYYNKKNNRNITSEELRISFEEFLESSATRSEPLDNFHNTIKGNFSSKDCNHDLDNVTFEDFERKVNEKLEELYGIKYYEKATEEKIDEAIDSITNWDDEVEHIDTKEMEKKYRNNQESTTEN